MESFCESINHFLSLMPDGEEEKGIIVDVLPEVGVRITYAGQVLGEVRGGCDF